MHCKDKGDSDMALAGCKSAKSVASLHIYCCELPFFQRIIKMVKINTSIFFQTGGNMKKLAILSIAFFLASCGTVGGLVSGAGTDLQKAGEWIKKK
jgi:predicted small secreted protein